MVWVIDCKFLESNRVEYGFNDAESATNRMDYSAGANGIQLPTADGPKVTVRGRILGSGCVYPVIYPRSSGSFTY